MAFFSKASFLALSILLIGASAAHDDEEETWTITNQSGHMRILKVVDGTVQCFKPKEFRKGNTPQYSINSSSVCARLEAGIAALPKGWKSDISSKTHPGVKYYYNPETSQRSWEYPNGDLVVHLGGLTKKESRSWTFPKRVDLRRLVDRLQRSISHTDTKAKLALHQPLHCDLRTLNVGQRIEVKYSKDDTWYPATYKGVDPRDRFGYVGIEYEDTPHRTIGVPGNRVRLARVTLKDLTGLPR